MRNKLSIPFVINIKSDATWRINRATSVTRNAPNQAQNLFNTHTCTTVIFNHRYFFNRWERKSYSERVPIVNYFSNPPTCPKVRVTIIHRPLWFGLEFQISINPPGQSGLPKSNLPTHYRIIKKERRTN